MDERLEKALDFSNYALTINNQKRNIRNITVTYIRFNFFIWQIRIILETFNINFTNEVVKYE